ncbi:MAG: cation-translocating P-type ATPase [Deltaproteobacteria bacterium]|nr:cation-translocating P-type ATPase [Deltaproteobacteria bacterium]
MDGLSDMPAGPRGGQVACSECGAPLDPLRAGHVAILNARYHFFCSYDACRARFVGRAAPPAKTIAAAPPPVAPRADLEAVLAPVRPAAEPPPAPSVPERVAVDDQHDLIEPVTSPVLSEKPPLAPTDDRREAGMLLVALALIAGALCMALEFAADGRLVQVARVVLLTVGSAALLGRAVTARPDGARPHWLVAVLPCVVVTLVASWALLMNEPADVARASFLAGTVLTVAAINLWLVGLAARPVHAGQAWVEDRLNVAARRVAGEPTQLSPKELVDDVRPGEHVVVEAGETVPVDVEIVEGEVEVLPWVGAATHVRRSVGDVVVAGSRVTQGQLRGRCTWAGEDRALARPLLSPARRIDVHGSIPRLARTIAERWSLVAAILAGGTFALLGWGVLEVGMVVAAVYAAIGNVAIGTLPGLSMARGARLALSRGVVHNTAAAWERCSRVTAAVFCARGTLLKGEPELVETEHFASLGGASSTADPTQAVALRPADEVLAIAAGALAGERHPVAIALRRAARDRAVPAAPVRNPRSFEGRGVAAVAATGEPLCIGNRSLMLERRISVAIAEQKIYELETSGRTVVLVAKAGRLLGLLALQDGLRSGARAAVQHLLDAKIEPILMSSDTRETCEALGRALDIDHLRPEVLAGERVTAVERIKDTGATVAVLGHTPHDDDALQAADASVAFAAAGRERDDFAVSLVSDDVRDAALALALAHQTRARAAAVLLMALGPAAVGALVVTIGLLPAEYAPLAQLVGALAVVWQLASYDRA